MLAYLAFVAAAATADLAGAILLTTVHRKGLAPLRYFVAGGAGFMLAAAFVRMLPESAQVPHAFLFVLIGYFGVHLFEHTVAPHFHFGEESHPEALLRPSAGYLALLGTRRPHALRRRRDRRRLHDRAALGVLLSIAVCVHKVPEGVTIASIMLAGGQSRATAIGAGALLGALTVVGAVATRFIAEHHVGYALALSAGVTIYVAASDLIPEVNREGGPALGWTVFAGLLLFALADWLVSPLGAH
jgi:ZIP family zinc transporter/zinc and cadmium transporter